MLCPPFLFLLAMEVLNNCMMGVVIEGLFAQIQVGALAISISHFFIRG